MLQHGIIPTELWKKSIGTWFVHANPRDPPKCSEPELTLQPLNPK